MASRAWTHSQPCARRKAVRVWRTITGARASVGFALFAIFGLFNVVFAHFLGANQTSLDFLESRFEGEN